MIPPGAYYGVHTYIPFNEWIFTDLLEDQTSLVHALADGSSDLTGQKSCDGVCA